MPLLMKNRVVAVKHETTLGTDSAPTATDATMNAYDVQMVPTLEYIERMQQGNASKIKGEIGTQHGTCTFKTPMSGNGAAVTAGWMTTLLGACGFTSVTDTWTPNTAAPNTSAGITFNHTATVATYSGKDPTNARREAIVGAMGSFKMNFTSGKLVEIEWTFTGPWAAVTDAPMLAPTYDTVRPIRFGLATLTIAGAAPGCVSNLTIDIGNEITLRECATNSTGYETAIVTNRNIKCTWDPESRLVATEDVFGSWLLGTEQAFSLALNGYNAAGSIVDVITIAMPKAQRSNIQPGDRGGVQVDQIEFSANASAAAGDDELTIDFS